MGFLGLIPPLGVRQFLLKVLQQVPSGVEAGVGDRFSGFERRPLCGACSP
jgi:hypothetical protein